MDDQRNGRESRPIKLSEVVSALEGRENPTISEEASVEEAIDRMTRFPHSRLLYVLDRDRRLCGTISLGNLVRHFFSRSHEPEVHPRFLISIITTEMARDIMQRHPIFATEEEDVEAVLKRMIEKNVSEIAVLDEDRRIVADVTMIDLLNFLIRQERSHMEIAEP